MQKMSILMKFWIIIFSGTTTGITMEKDHFSSMDRNIFGLVGSYLSKSDFLALRHQNKSLKKKVDHIEQLKKQCYHLNGEIFFLTR